MLDRLPGGLGGERHSQGDKVTVVSAPTQLNRFTAGVIAHKMTINKTMVFSGVFTLIQAITQMVLTSLGIAQHFCVIDFLKEFQILIYLRILYFHNPSGCGVTINIGQAIDGIANQAFVLLTREPFTAFRTFIINSIGLGLSALWIIVSVTIMMAGSRNNQSKHARWPWIIITVAICVLDLIATVTYANDSFHTRTLTDTINFIGGIVSGVGNVELNTSWAAWTMVLLYSRLIVIFVMNVFLVIVMIIDCNVKVNYKESIAIQVEAPRDENSNSVTVQTTITEVNNQDVEVASTPSVLRTASRIPRPGLSHSFRKMKTLLFGRPATPQWEAQSSQDSLEPSPERSPKLEPVDADKKRTVNFPENLLSLPQRLENMIVEHQRRLDNAVVNTAGRSKTSVTQASTLEESGNTHIDAKGRRGTTAELQGQLPWAYIPAPAHRMRDHLPPDEDLPPVPLPDYNALPSIRKASVHRAASGLSSLSQLKDNTTQSTRQGDDD